MAVSNGQPANQDTFNNAFLSKPQGGIVAGVVELANVDAPSGASIGNTQRELNSLASFLGKSLGTVFNDLPFWSDNQIGSSTDSIFTRLNLASARFNNSSGHGHTGAPGDAPQIDASNLSNYNPFFQIIQVLNVGPFASTSELDVTTEFASKSPFGTLNTNGVLTVRDMITVEDDSNMVRLRENRQPILDSDGNEVFGWLHYDDDLETWTLKMYSYDGLSNNPYSHATDGVIQIYYKEIFSGSRPTVWPLLEFGLFGSGSGSGGGAGAGFENLVIESNGTNAFEVYENAFKEYGFDPDSTQTISALVKVPDAFESGQQLQLDFAWATPSTSGNVVWSLTTQLFRPTSATRGTPTDTATDSETVAVDGTTNQIQTQTLDISDVSGFVDSTIVEPGDILLLSLSRLGSDAADTCTGDIYAIAHSLKVKVA